MRVEAHKERVKAAVSSVVDETRVGIASLRGHHFHAPPAHARIRRFFWPASILVALFRALWSDPETKRIYLRAMIPQLAVTVVIAFFGVALSDSFSFDASGDTLAVKAEHGAKSTVAFFAAWYGALTVVEWCVLWLGRQAHDSISFHVAKLVGVPCDEPEKPKSRIELRALFENLSRKLRNTLVVVATFVPATLVAYVATYAIVFVAARLNVGDAVPIDDVDHALDNVIPNVVPALVGAYWFSVFTIGKSALAWRSPSTPLNSACEPAFLRALSSSKSPRIAQRYARFLRRLIADAAKPAFYSERALYESAGLALARAIASFPGIYLLVRPLLAVTASMILVERAPACLPASENDNAATTPASEAA